MSYGKAYNTPTINALYTNLIFGRWGENFTMILKETEMELHMLEQIISMNMVNGDSPVNLNDPFFYEIDNEGNYTGNTIKLGSSGLNDCVFDPNNPCDPYINRVQGAPLF